MIVLHAGFWERYLFLWGESPAEEKTSRGSPRRQKRNDTLVKPLRYNAGREKVLAALAESDMRFRSTAKHSDKVIVWLPTKGGNPIASSPLIANVPESRDETVIAPWAITGVALAAQKTIELLCVCAGKQTLTPGVVVGSDLTFWAAAMRFAGALVAKQMFLPGVKEEQGKYNACWEPIFSGEDAGTLTKLAGEMPAACRALTSEGDMAPEVSSRSIIADFVSGVVDYLVRSSISEERSAVVHRKCGKKTQEFDSIHDQWLHALRAPDSEMAGEAAELSEFAAQVRNWRHPVSVTTSTPFKLCFRLEEPPGGIDTAREVTRGRENWNVCYLLQASDDPSLLIPAKDAWNPRGGKKDVLKRGSFNPREYLLTSLGQASNLCPNIEASLKDSAPGGYELDTTGAYGFLMEKAVALEQSGFGVMLPAWWTRKGTKIRLSVSASVRSPKMQGGSGISLGSIVQFDWEVALGDEKLTLEELEALANLKAPLVQVRGQWVQMSAEEIQAAIDFWKKKSVEETSVRDIIQMSLGAKEAAAGFDFRGVEASGWVGELLKQLEGSGKFEEIEVPRNFSGMLRPYQLRGYSWLSFLRRWGLGACLADDMGLGKTVQALALIQRDWHSDGKRPVLIICPTSVIANWGKEAHRFTPELPVMLHHGSERAKGEDFREKAQAHAIVISSYALLHRDFESLNQVEWAGVILDEAQNVKNPQTKQSKAARSLKGDYRVVLTGTPVENNVGDLWSIMEFLNPGFLGTQARFKKDFFIPIQAGRDPDAAKRLKRITGPFILRREKTDKSVISDLPEKMEMKVFCTLTKEQASLYAAVVKEASEGLNSSGGIKRKGIILATLSKLKQVCNHPAQFLGDNSPIPGRSGKLSRLTEMLEEIIEVQDSALVFTQFAEMGEILRRHLQETFGREALFLHGAVPRKKREEMIERFQSGDKSPNIFILSLKAGGTGLNLTRANHVFHFDRWWNPAVENQATDRAFRIGQTKNVQVHKFLCVGTLEEKIDEMIERKKDVAASVIGTGEKWLTELSNDQIRELFALRKEAVAE